MQATPTAVGSTWLPVRALPGHFRFVIGNEADAYRLWLNTEETAPRRLLVEIKHAPSGPFFPLEEIAPPVVDFDQPQRI